MFNRRGPKRPSDLSQLSGPSFEEHDRCLRRYLRSRTNDPEAINDVAQQTYANVIAAIRRGENIPHLRAYLLRTARNAHIDLIRRKKVGERFVDVDSATLDEEKYPHDLSRDDPLENVAVIQELEECLRKLSRQEQRIIFLECWADSAVRKTAEEYDLTEGTARKYRDRAAANFRAIINGK